MRAARSPRQSRASAATSKRRGVQGAKGRGQNRKVRGRCEHTPCEAQGKDFERNSPAAPVGPGIPAGAPVAGTKIRTFSAGSLYRSVMRVTFYGVRGSIATPGLSTVRYGGNTVCVDVRLLDGTVVVSRRRYRHPRARPGVARRATRLRSTRSSRMPTGITSSGSRFSARSGAKTSTSSSTPSPRWRKNGFVRTRSSSTRSTSPFVAADIPARIELVDAHRRALAHWVGDDLAHSAQSPRRRTGLPGRRRRRRVDLLPDRQRARRLPARRPPRRRARAVLAQRRAPHSRRAIRRGRHAGEARLGTFADQRRARARASGRGTPPWRCFITSQSETTKRSIVSASARACGSKTRQLDPSRRGPRGLTLTVGPS